MNAGIGPRAHPRALAARIIVGFAGVAYVLIAMALLFAPEWFFQNIGPFPPFNRHYEGDLGTFILALGLGLLLAARDPARHRLVIAVGALASGLHALNHIYDALADNAPLGRWLTDVAPLALFAVLLALPIGMKEE